MSDIKEHNEIHHPLSYGVIYIYSIPLETHKGRLKIGSATVNLHNPNQREIEAAAHNRIKQQTKTADISYQLEYCELAINNDGKYFSDYDVHEVLKRSGYDRKSENIKNTHSEWFEVNLEVAKNAIQAVKEGRMALLNQERNVNTTQEFSFRPNQLDAINKTTQAIKKKRKHFLWNAKMRFGKTSAAMQVAKVNSMKKVLIVTHRPSVGADWLEDFNKVLASSNYEYSSKTEGEDINMLIKNDRSFVYFASLQDLRLSKRVVADESSGSQSSGFEKNDEIFDTTWDMLIIDEAHEGTQSKLGDTTFQKIPNNFTLQLSGTPFNILHKHEEEDIYTWDYVMEQEEKQSWDENHPGVPNPYAELPSLSIFTYDIDTFANHIGSLGDGFKDSLDGAFRFHEFFRVRKDDDGNDTAEFVHAPMVKKFLDLLVNETLPTKFPYATSEYRGYNKHALWLLPNRTKVIEAMEKLLKDHPIFGKFGIVNISGDSRDDDEDTDAKNRVTNAIKNNDYTVTLTGQRLTTGASIKEWTAVFMMSDTSSATTYLQTAFRCQTPAKIDGKIKTQGYVFDFAPDRTLRLIAEAIELNHKSGKINSPEQKEAMKEFLNFCPILAAKGGSMKLYDVGTMLAELKKAIIERVSRNGFDDIRLYNDELLHLEELDIERFKQLSAIISKSTGERTNEIKINELGMTDLQKAQAEAAEKKKRQKESPSEEEAEVLKKLKELRKQKYNAISILKGVSIRMPMLVYGADVSIREDITLDKFIDLVDDESWQEFMPVGLTKDQFRGFTKYYDEEVFKGVAHSIRAKAFDCDNLLPTERIQAIAELFSTFKNPDKETVLTPWKVVNMHVTLAFGGHDFTSVIHEKPEWISKDVDTSVWTVEDSKILEINSKSGLYPLLAAYNIYTRQLKKEKKGEDEISKDFWKKVLRDHIYVLCKSPMAESITRRTLAGYNLGFKTNIAYIHDLVAKLQQKNEYKNYNLKKELYEKFNLQNPDMKFTAVIGNPPYQEETKDTSDNPIYNHFIDGAYILSDNVCLIHPARFLFNGGKTPKAWNEKILNNKHVRVIFYEHKSSKVFPNTDIKGGIAITQYNATKDFGIIGTFTSNPKLNMIKEKILSHTDFRPLSEIIHLQNKFHLDELYKDNPGYVNIIGSNGKEKRLTSPIFEQLDIFTDDSAIDTDIRILGLIKNKRIQKWINKKYLEKHANFDKYKVLVPKANGSGALGETLSSPLVVEPFTGFTFSFISFGAFEIREDAEAMLKYVKTKFLRTMLGMLKITQDNLPRTWSYVPLQDFTEQSDIDWTQSVADIDNQLYAKYSLDQAEIDFIESHVKPMI